MQSRLGIPYEDSKFSWTKASEITEWTAGVRIRAYAICLKDCFNSLVSCLCVAILKYKVDVYS